MSWILLIIAGLFEIGFAVVLKFSEGFTKPVPGVLTVLSMAASLWLLALAVRHLPIGTAYAVWTGIGAVGTAVIGMTLLGEPRHAARVLCVVLIALGIMGLKLFGDKPHTTDTPNSSPQAHPTEHAVSD